MYFLCLFFPPRENNYRRKEKNKKDPEFMEGVGGVTPITEQPLLNKIQRRIQELCEWNQLSLHYFYYLISYF